MKKTLLLVLASAFFFACAGEKNNAVINGSVIGLDDEARVYLSRCIDGDMLKLDSVSLADGKFAFVIEDVYPEELYIQFEGQRTNVPFVAEKGAIEIEASLEGSPDTKVSGSRTNDLLLEFQEMTKELHEQRNGLYKKYGEAENEEERKALMGGFAEIRENMSAIQKEFVAANSNEIVAAYLLSRELTYGYTPERMDSLLGFLGTKIPANKFLDELNERREVLLRTSPGQPAPDFTLPQPDGTPFTFSSLKGQVILVDFWASWCVPCRQENPNIVKLYNKYKDHGFTIVGASLDTNREAWLEAIQKDGLDWTHVSEFKLFNTQAAKDYGVIGIPHTILIDREGKIIENVVFGEKLEKLVAQALGIDVIE